MIKLKYEGQEYLLEFDRASVEILERLGFNINEYTDKMATMQPILFRGAFYKNHKFEKNIDYEKIWENVGNKKGLMKALLDMVGATYQTLMSDNGGNQNWEVI